MKLPIHVTVTIKEIVDGERCDPFRCPISLSIQRSLVKRKDAYIVRVDNLNVTIEQTNRIGQKHKHNRIIFRLPNHVKDFIRLFDQRLRVDPFQFNLTTDEVMRLLKFDRLSNQGDSKNG